MKVPIWSTFRDKSPHIISIGGFSSLSFYDVSRSTEIKIPLLPMISSMKTQEYQRVWEISGCTFNFRLSTGEDHESSSG